MPLVTKAIIMEKLAIFLFVLFSVSAIQAQTNAIKANPLGFLVGWANVEYEFKTNDSQSLSINAL